MTLEDKIMAESIKDNLKEIEIVKEDIGGEDRNILLDRKEIIHKFNKVLTRHRIKFIVSMILLTVSSLCIAYAPKVSGNTINLIATNTDYQ